jgi:hypothetical protein
VVALPGCDCLREGERTREPVGIRFNLYTEDESQMKQLILITVLIAATATVIEYRTFRRLDIEHNQFHKFMSGLSIRMPKENVVALIPPSCEWTSQEGWATRTTDAIRVGFCLTHRPALSVELGFQDDKLSEVKLYNPDRIYTTSEIPREPKGIILLLDTIFVVSALSAFVLPAWIIALWKRWSSERRATTIAAEAFALFIALVFSGFSPTLCLAVM